MMEKEQKWEVYLKKYMSNIEEYVNAMVDNIDEMSINNARSIILEIKNKIEKEFDNNNFKGEYFLDEEENLTKIGELLGDKKWINNKISEMKISLKLKDNPCIATHFGDDLDNKSCVYILNNFAKSNGIIEESESLELKRVPAGQVIDGIVNVDTGGHKGSKFEDTIVVDGDPKNNITSAVQELKDIINAEVPEQILECADTMPTNIDIFDTRSGLSLQKFASTEKVFEMAKRGMLTRELTDEELEEFGLVENQKAQQKIVDEGKEKVEKYTIDLGDGKKAVICPEFIKAGSQIAYKLGAQYYASVSKHYDQEKNEDGSTFSITAKPGSNLPESVKKFGNELVEEYKNEDGTSGVFLHPNGSLLVAGGPKNPDFKVNMSLEEMQEKITELFMQREYENMDIQTSEVNVDKLKEEVSSLMKDTYAKVDKSVNMDEKIKKAEDLEKEVNKFIESKSKNKGE